MAIYLPNRFIYLRHPRTASSATSRTLLSIRGTIDVLPNVHITLPKIKQKYRNLSGHEHIFTTVRNHFDTLVSWFFAMNTKPYKDLEDFIRRYESDDFAIEDRLFFHVPDCNEILRYENLQEDLNQTLEKIGFHPIELITLNETKDKKHPYQDYYSPLAIKAVQDRFGKEMDELGYAKTP